MKQTLSKTKTSTVRFGFTLVELVAASVLASILMVVVLLSLRQSFADAATGSAVRSAGSPDLLLDLIGQDITNAHGASLGRNQSILAGPIATTNTRPTLGRAVVSYEVDRGRLFRTERGPIPRRDLLWLNVAEFTMFGSMLRSEGDAAATLPPSDTAGLPVIPPSVSVRLVESDGRVVFVRSFASGVGG